MNSEDHAFSHLDLEAEFGPALRRYDGRGTLLTAAGASCECEFSILALRRGVPVALSYISPEAGFRPSFFLSDGPFELQGTTFEGVRIEAAGLEKGLMLPSQEERRSGHYSSYRAENVRAVENPSRKARAVRFGLTNLQLPPTPLRLNVAGHTFSLERVQDFHRRSERISSLREVDVTAELVFDAGHTATLEELVDDLGHLLSLAAGTRISRIYCHVQDADLETIEWRHTARRTSRFTALSALDLETEGVLERFVTSCFSAYRDRQTRWRLRELTSAFLDTKSEQVSIQPRGVMMATAIEMLKAEFIKAESPTTTILPASDWKRLCKQIQRTVQENCPTKDTRETIYKNLTALNRRSFRDLLSELCHHLSWEPEEGEVKRFVDSRNSLVHNGRFHCEGERSGPDLRSRMEEEYFFLVSFLDRLFLRLVGYDGPYTPWRER